MKIKKVEIEAFRAYKTKADGTFDFTNEGDNPSNFVAIYAPNGFGKSSFYDAVEWAVTNHLERLGGEYNKSNFERAAKSTKHPNEGQKILRNKYVDKQVITKVAVSTTRPIPFENELPKLRANGRDLSFGDNSQRRNEFFRRVVLSQDEIDRFLREAKPQERYAKFMESFGGDTEIARKELSALISDNNAELSVLNKQCQSLIEELKQPINPSIFEHFNSVAAELNAAGENIILPDEKFSSQSEYQLNASLVARQHELNTLLQAKTKTLEVLADRLAKMPEIERHINYQVEQKPQLTRLLKGVADADKYQMLFDSYNKCMEDQKQAHVHLTRLIEIAENTETFLITESRLLELSTIQKALTEERSNSIFNLTSLEQQLIELNSELKIADDRALLLRNSVDNAGAVYVLLSNHRAQIGTLSQQITAKEITIQVDKIQLDELNRELKEVSALSITSNLLLTGNVGVLLFDQDKIEQLRRCQADLDLIEVHNQALSATQKALTEQMEQHEQLVAIGLDYLAVQPSHICPLCTTHHSSTETLLEKVTSQNLMSELSLENSKKLSLSFMRQKELREAIQAITEQAVEAQVQQLGSLHKKLTEVSERHAQAVFEKSTLEAECNTLEVGITELEKLVWGLSNDELVSRVETELSQLATKRFNLLERQAELSNQVQSVTTWIKSKDSELCALISESERKSSEHVYVTIKTYLNENAIAASELKKHCETKKIEFDTEVLKYKDACESLASQCNLLKQEMMADGTWMDFANLKLQKVNLEVSFTRSQTAVNSFYESLSDIIIVQPEDTVEKVKGIITGAIEDCRLQTQELNKLLNSIKLLLELMVSFKPYIKRISLQEEFTNVEKLLEQRNRVDVALKEERDKIVDSLKMLINNFFYEDLINSIYRKIDPHPAFKKVEFRADFDSDKPGLNIVVSDGAGGLISPILYFSAAQTNILSLSVFLANALHAKDDEGNPINVILIDDPIQSMDSINILSTIDLLRSICLQFDKQIIISTHDENFFKLLQRKIPTQILGSKFLQLEKFGVVVSVDSFVN
ncbi:MULTISPECIES: AAA family ATPase [Acinetobacter]|uniref:DNA repair protein n=1 Tax=Acinetobacter chengduensis TaxID=2420890 RepID=A0ABX9TXD5_9GAMM|nr:MULTISPECIES: AAA family ATPase [Acinetobacter]RKG40797.1 DNA repair protein [Acinetobacter sp. WCHAc060007]RLL22822.1 DNA repair protein [Acinetobacter chengduensis]